MLRHDEGRQADEYSKGFYKKNIVKGDIKLRRMLSLIH